MKRRPEPVRRPLLPQYGVEPTKVLAVGRDQHFIEQISRLLRTEDRVNLLGGALDRTGAAERLVLLRPDVIVIDVDLDYEMGGIDTAFALRRISPNTAFVLISPYSDAERLSMVPRGLGLEWSYLLSDQGIDAGELASAVTSAAWSIPYIDKRIDRSRLGALQDESEKAVQIALQAPTRHRSKRAEPKLGYANSAGWYGRIHTFKLPEFEPGDDTESEA
jgi:DNA-binding NarL/FixJ family response regulator